MFSNRRKYVRVRTWDTTKDLNLFPERHDPDVKIDALDSKADFGVCFSGGGTRSASATLGQLRGLSRVGLLERARYMCAVSGGSWTATPFIYLPESFDDDIFLGPHIEPEHMTDEALEYRPDGSMAKAIHRSVLFDNLLKNFIKLRGDESYARAIGDIFLKRFNLDKPSKFFTWDKRSLQTVLNNNNEDIDTKSFLKPTDFVLAKSDRPYLIIGATLLFGPKKTQTIVPMEITPLYTGCRQHLKAQGKDLADIGGCYVESFGYDSKFKTTDTSQKLRRVRFWSGIHLWRKKKYFFTLADAIGTSGAAPAETLREKGVTNVGFPEFRHWSVHTPAKGHAEYQHGDGGFADNLGIMPLLARQTKSILVFVNSPRPFDLAADSDWYDSRFGGRFGFAGTPDPDALGSAQKSIENQVFAQEGLSRLIAGLKDSQNNNETLIHFDEYDVISNQRYGIQSYQGVKVVWIYNSDVSAWRDALPDTVSKDLRTRKNNFKSFPNFPTFMFKDGKPKAIDLAKEQVNALAHLSCWNVLKNEQAIKTHLSI